MSKKILIIERDEAVAKKMLSALQAAGYDINRAADFMTASELCRRENPQLVILMNSVPFADYMAEFIQFRKVAESMILVVGRQDDLVEALENGADAFSPARISMIELLARVGSLIQRSERQPLSFNNSIAEATSKPE